MPSTTFKVKNYRRVTKKKKKSHCIPSSCFCVGLHSWLCSAHTASLTFLQAPGSTCPTEWMKEPCVQGMSAGTTHFPSALAFPKCLPLLPVPSPSGATGQALLQTCVPPAATQDTRGRSSARVLGCSLRTRMESWEPWQPAPHGSSCR